MCKTWEVLEKKNGAGENKEEHDCQIHEGSVGSMKSAGVISVLNAQLKRT